MRERCTDRARDVRIRNEFARFQLSDETPYGNLKRRASQPQRQIEATQAFLEISAQLFRCFYEERVVARRSPCRHTRAECARRYLAIGCCDKEPRAQWRRNDERVVFHAAVYHAWEGLSCDGVQARPQ